LEKWKKFQKGRSAIAENAKIDIADSMQKARNKATALAPINGNQSGSSWKIDVLQGRKQPA
jgi:hypothetical protein